MLQMLSYLTLVNLRYPANVLSFLDCIEAVHNSNAWIPNLFAYILNKEDLVLQPYNPQFEDRGFSSRYFLMLCSADLIMMLVMLVAIGLLSLLASLCK